MCLFDAIFHGADGGDDPQVLNLDEFKSLTFDVPADSTEVEQVEPSILSFEVQAVSSFDVHDVFSFDVQGGDSSGFDGYDTVPHVKVQEYALGSVSVDAHDKTPI